MTANREIELKLELDWAHRAALQHLPLIKSAEGETQHLVAIYFDTPDKAIWKSGYSLRVRRKGRRRVQTVKARSEGAAGLYARSEWEKPVKGDQPVIDASSGPLEDVIGAEGGRDLVPVCVTDIARDMRQLAFEGAEIELAIDEGSVRAGECSARLCELELELRSGSPRALFDLARQIDGSVPLRLSVQSKAERGYALAKGGHAGPVKADAVALDPDMAASDAFGAIAGSCMRQFRFNEKLLLDADDSGALHQARVGLRRLRSAFSLFKPLLGDDEQAMLLSAELRRLANGMGDARNLDVLIERMAERRTDPVLAHARRRAFEHARSELASARSRLLMLDLAEWLGVDLPETGLAQVRSGTIECFAADILDRARKKLRKRGRDLAELSEERLHRLRIQAKKARYAVEFFESLWPAAAAQKRRKAWLSGLKKLQDRLGELNDIAVGTRILVELGVERKPPGCDGDKIEALRSEAADAFARLMDAEPWWRS